MIRILSSLVLIICLGSVSGLAQESLTCGVAIGFPPYQFAIDDEPAGFDVDVAKAVCARLGVAARFKQGKWDDVINMLLFDRIDMVVGMEVNAFRHGYFEFSTPYATRHDVVFVLANSTVSRVEDLFGLVITGDRHSFVELRWKEVGIHQKIRIMQTGSKEESMDLLARGETAAAIMPLEVGKYLAALRGLEIRTLINPDPGSDVAIALRKGHPELLSRINGALRDLQAEGKLDALARKWFSGTAPTRRN
ncbi:polar amino acid transport system substrate-binding protein/cystine transport system substrate-binding protein [Desulfomicrobium norvegicum]|uniref:Polar amino acid transport system substrate-binding protein/cystine transport system substrate-binding protein n=1 Tax=Desulfomicrobium norvegicum (strain DSM 1741 / NCIMB 8310) TaxID=52561 RepID=A0A8G2C5U4_DESNO|nr:transporter substrate-binding domain-containing protein [Desulfomicrobium norvegicum]SFM16078.1 polar amino acid transport system substrate-binding protein/cystine transport system substrate-binding protein [Desulfomicrobium norvegicum]